MEIYDVKLAEGVVVRVKAGNPKDAKAKALAAVAKREGSKAYDKVFFDYETGIQDNSLRASLSVAEDFYDETGKYVSEKENVLKDYVGSGGFIRDSKGSIALTPLGQSRIGLKASNKNIVIDENKRFTSGDFADMAGYAGPILGSVAAVNPYMRGVKFLRGLLGSAVGRPLLVGAGAAGGKGVEEANEMQRGLQMQNEEEIAGMLKDEALLGFVAQGAGEALGGIFATYFGKTADVGAIRDSKFLMEGWDLTDIFRIDSQLAIKKNILDPASKKIDQSYKASRKEVLKELKKQKIKPKFKNTRGIVTQSALGRSIPARGQSIAEAVTGSSKREKLATNNLLAQMNRFFESVGKKDATVDEFISSGVIGKIATTEFKKATSNFQGAVNQTDNLLDDLLKNMLDEMNTVRFLNYKGLAKEGAVLKQELQDIMYQSYNTWNKSNNEMYQAAEKALKQNIGDETITKALQAEKGRFKEILDDFNTQDEFFQYSGATYKYIKDLSEGKVDNLQKLINARKEFAAVQNDLYSRGKSSGSIYRAVKAADIGVKNLLDSVGTGNAFLGKGVTKESIEKSQQALKIFNEATQNYASTVGKYQGTVYKDIINKIKAAKGGNGKLDPEEIFGFIDDPLKGDQIKEILNAVNPDLKEVYRGQLTALLFKNAIADSVDPATKLINPVSLSKNIMKYDNKGGNSTLKELFGPKYSQNIALLKDINALKPKITHKEMKNFMLRLETNPEKFIMTSNPNFKGGMIPEIDTANKILETFKKRATIAQDAEAFSKKQFMRNVNNETPEKIVQNIFRPNSAADIKYLKLNMKPYKRINPETGVEEIVDTFSLIQENAMGQLLTDAVSVGKLKTSAKLSDIFKPNQFRNALESYGDETLEAMFGKEQLIAFKALQQSLDLQVGAAKGLTAGGIVAGAIGAQALNISLMPTILGLKVFSLVFSNPRIVKLMANTDTGSVMAVLEAFTQAARLAGAKNIYDSTSGVKESITQEMRQQIESPENQSAAEELRGQVEQVTKPLLNAIPDLPDIMPTNPTAQNNQAPISRSLLGGSSLNEDIAQSLGRLA